MKIGLLVPHIFMQADILPQVIFSPGKLGIQLADDLAGMGGSVTLFTPGAVPTKAANITANLSYFEKELNARGDNYLDLLRKHPFTFVTLARQVQTELVAKAIKMANDGEFDILHVYTNEEDIALPLAQLCSKPIVFTHHDPYNFLVKYKSVFPKYPQLNWISMSRAQRQGMPANTNWVGNIYHGLPAKQYKPVDQPSGDYVAYMGRIINTKGVHLAIMAVQKYNSQAGSNLILKIAGKHYAEHQKDTYWQTHIKPYLGKGVEYLGYIKSDSQKTRVLRQRQSAARAVAFRRAVWASDDRSLGLRRANNRAKLRCHTRGRIKGNRNGSR